VRQTKLASYLINFQAHYKIVLLYFYFTFNYTNSSPNPNTKYKLNSTPCSSKNFNLILWHVSRGPIQRNSYETMLLLRFY